MPGIIDERRFGFVTWEGATIAEEYLAYAGLAALLRPRRILEIGVFDGVSTAALYSGAKVFGNEPQMFCVDISIRAEKIKANFRAMGVGGPDLGENFVFLEGDSRKVLPELQKFGLKFDLVLIDGCHDERFVREDWANVQHLLNDRGVVIFHDVTTMPWIGRIVDEIEAERVSVLKPCSLQAKCSPSSRPAHCSPPEGEYCIYYPDEATPMDEPVWNVWRWRGMDYPPGHRAYGEKVYLRDRGNAGFALVRRNERFVTPSEKCKDWQGVRSYMRPVADWPKGWGYDMVHVIPDIDPDKPAQEVEFPSTPRKLKLIAGDGEDVPSADTDDGAVAMGADSEEVTGEELLGAMKEIIEERNE